MAKYAVSVVIDLNISLRESTRADEVERITGNTLRILVDKKSGCEIKRLTTTLFGKADDFQD